MEASDVARHLESGELRFVQLGLVDSEGALRWKWVAAKKVRRALEDGYNSLPVFYADAGDVLQNLPPLSDGGEGFADGRAEVLRSSLRCIPWEPRDRNVLALISFTDYHADFDPRRVCERVLARAERAGFAAYSGCEFEGTLFRETHESAVAKGYDQLTRVTPASDYARSPRSLATEAVLRRILEASDTARTPLASAHLEIGASTLEAALEAAVGIEAPERAACFKYVAREVARRQDLLLSFMARWSDEADGHSGHLHLSLRTPGGEPVFAADGDRLNDPMRWFLGGLCRYTPELLLLAAPNVNSFKRFVPGRFAPTAACWGFENRTCAFRVIGGGPDATRIEVRVPGADANPFLSLSMVLAAGLAGIEERLDPGSPTVGNAWESADATAPERRFPETFAAAIERFRESKIAGPWLGETFVDGYASTRASQDREFRSLVSNLERRRFLETS